MTEGEAGSVHELVGGRLGRLLGLAAAELVAAGVLVAGFVLLWRSADEPHVGHAAVGAPEAVTVAVLVAATVAGSLAFSRALKATRGAGEVERWRPWLLPAAALVAGLALLPWTWLAASASHLAMMAQMMALLVTAPALVALGARRRTRASATRVWASAAAYVAALYLWHVPHLHSLVMTSRGAQAAMVASVVAAGLWFWRGILSPSSPAGTRAVMAVGGASGVLGLALLLSPYALMASGMAPWGLGAVADQRVAGALMMLLDILVLIPVMLRGGAESR